MLTRIGELAVRRRKLVLVLGAIGLVAAGAIGGNVSKHLSSGGFDDPNAENARAAHALHRVFGSDQPNLVLVVTAKNGSVDGNAVSEDGARITEELAATPHVVQAVSYWTLGSPPPLRSHDSRQALVLARITGTDDEVGQRVKTIAPKFTRSDADVTVGVGGFAQVFNQVGPQIRDDLGKAEAITLPVVLVLLIIVFGSVVAATLPLGVGVLAIVGTFLVLRVIALLTHVSIYSLNLTTGMGLALAIDYSLFVVSRYREEIRQGASTEAAVVRTVQTAGRTVAFGALTVAASLVALLVFPLYFLRSFAYAGIPVVALAAVGAVVVLPAGLAALGPRVDKWVLWHHEPKPIGEGGWHRIAVAVMRRPIPIGLGVVAILVLLGAPFFTIKFGLPDDRVLPKSATSRQVQDQIRRNFSSNEAAALSVVAPNAPDTPGRRDTVAVYAAQLSLLDGAARVDSATGSYIGGSRVAPPNPGSVRFDGKDGTWLSVVPNVEPMSAKGERLVHEVRDHVAPFRILVTGSSAQLVDSKSAMFGRMPLAIAVIAVITFVMLFLFSGSVVIPIKALILNLLSLSATFGAMVWIFQEGHLSKFLDFTPVGTLDTSTPILMFCVAFGLSMDYEVFLLSRIKEEHDRSHDNVSSVAIGLERTGRIVTAAAALLAVVFLAFATSKITFIKLFGVGLSLAIIMDATLIRATLVPAFMRLAGEVNWWAPGPLRRFHDRFGFSEAEPEPALERRDLGDMLGVQPDAHVAVVGAVSDDVTRALERAAGRLSREAKGGADVVVFGPERGRDLERLIDLRKSMKPEGAIWVVRPDDKPVRAVRAAGRAAGLVDAETVQLSDDLAADRLVRDGNGHQRGHR